MDPQTKSVLGSVGMIVATSLASWAVTKGYITPDQQSAAVTSIITLLGAIAAAAALEYKRRSVSKNALIQAVNEGDNGVKVVDAKAPVPQVSVALK